MKRFVEGLDRSQGTLFPERLDDWICQDNPVLLVSWARLGIVGPGLAASGAMMYWEDRHA